MNGAPHNFELLEPPSPEALLPDPWVETWMIVAAAALLFGLLALVIFLRRKKSATADPMAIRQAAYSEAVAALEAIRSTGTREVAVQGSLIVRKYLSAAAGDPALFETHEEYISRHEALKNFTDEARTAAGTGFTRLATLKYAADVPDVAAAEVIAGSRALLETLHHGFRA
ncbi:MAG: hypothetical protein ABIS50_04075 [Luteolibacter sp.]|uniref:hypothetical protein n=1 Tax=Luteolibacter sp. TaxID=1962973 RepID=UPI003265ED3C